MNAEYERKIKEAARQLSCPEGEKGIKAAKNMNVANIGMISETVDSLQLSERKIILEIGPGNGSHLRYVLEQASELSYIGIDISELMVKEARKVNSSEVESGKASFILSEDENQLPFSDNFFDAVFTVNTLYFWKEPVSYLKEINRVMKSGARLSIGFIEKSSMEKLSFTRYGFHLYDMESAIRLTNELNFFVRKIKKKNEKVLSGRNEVIERSFAVLTLYKV